MAGWNADAPAGPIPRTAIRFANRPGRLRIDCLGAFPLSERRSRSTHRPNSGACRSLQADPAGRANQTIRLGLWLARSCRKGSSRGGFPRINVDPDPINSASTEAVALACPNPKTGLDTGNRTFPIARREPFHGPSIDAPFEGTSICPRAGHMMGISLTSNGLKSSLASGGIIAGLSAGSFGGGGRRAPIPRLSLGALCKGALIAGSEQRKAVAHTSFPLDEVVSAALPKFSPQMGDVDLKIVDLPVGIDSPNGPD